MRANRLRKFRISDLRLNEHLYQSGGFAVEKRVSSQFDFGRNVELFEV